MKSRILSFNILTENMKKQIWVPVLITLGFFLCMPIAGMIYLETLKSGNRTELEIIQAYTRFLVGTKLPFLFTMTVGSAVLTGVSGFSWLHSRIQTDFYHSLPLRREKLFLNQVVLGIVYYAVPYLVNLVLAYVVGMVHGIFQGNMVRLSLTSFLYQFVFYLMTYFVVVLAMLLTGKVLLGCLGAVVLAFYGPGFDLLLQGMASIFFDTYITANGAFDEVLLNLSPLISYFTCLPDDFQSIPGKALGLGFLGAAVLAVLCFFLYQRRPSEAAGRSMAFFRLGKLIQYLIEMLVILGSGVLFYSITSFASLGWMVFGIVLGGVLIHGIMEVVYEGDIRRVMAHPWMMGVSMVTALLVIGIFYKDIFGYDDFFPKQEELKTVRIQSDGINYGGDFIKYNQEELAAMEKMAADPAVYEVLREIQESRLWRVSTKNGLEHRRGAELEAVEQIQRIEVEYGLNSGKNTRRVYYVDYDECREKLLPLYDSPDYKKTIYPLTTMTEEDLETKIQGIELYSITGNTSQLFTGSSEARVDFLNTFRGELMQMDQKTVTEETPIGQIVLTAEWGYGENEAGMTWDEAQDIENTDYYIYPSFTKTLALLEKQDVKLPEEFPAENIISVTLYDSRDDEHKEKKITDRDKIEKLLPNLLSRECDNGLIDDYGYQVYAEVIVKENGYKESVSCMVRRDRELMPDLSEFLQ